MAASVRIEDEAFVDTRIELLGFLAGYNRFEALGRMAHLWRVCTQRESYVLDPVWIAACLGDKGPAAIVACGLAETVENGIRIKGTQGRIEWLQERRTAAQKGGQANKHRAIAKRSQVAAKRHPEGSQVGAKAEPKHSQTGAKLEPEGSQVGAEDKPNGSPPTPTPCLPSEDEDIRTPEPPKPAGSVPPKREPNPWFDVVQQIAGVPATKRNSGRIAQIANDVKAAGITPEELREKLPVVVAKYAPYRKTLDLITISDCYSWIKTPPLTTGPPVAQTRGQREEQYILDQIS